MDAEIQELIQERKPLPEDYMARLQVRPKRGHKERELVVAGEGGHQFQLILRQNEISTLDFSLILAYLPAGTNQVFRLRRYNGKSHWHTNTIEEQTFFDFHVHEATARYQELGMREDSFAAPAAHYSDIHSALQRLLAECGFEVPSDPQGFLFRKVMA